MQTDGDLWWRSFREGDGQKAGSGNPATKDFLPSTSNYVGNKGTIDAGCPGSGVSPNWQPDPIRCPSNGILFANSKVTLRQISDGTGKTFIIGERDRFCMAGTWIGARFPYGGDQMHSSLWCVAHTAIDLNYPWTQAYETCTEGFSSPHKGGGFFAFCDGSVRYIKDDISSILVPPNSGNGGRACTAVKADSNHCIARLGTNVIGVYQRLSWRDDAEEVDDSAY
jgi:prepilin-type processing-associated H-X9-DG protein